MTLGVGDIFQNITSQGPLDKGQQAAAQVGDVTIAIAELSAETALVTENVFVNEGGKAIQLPQ